MLGIFLIYFIGKSFYNLAEIHDKRKWVYAIIGVVSYYSGAIVGGIIIAICLELFGMGSIEDINDFSWNIIALVSGLFSCWIFHKLLQRHWNKKSIDKKFMDRNTDILDIDFINKE